MKARVNEGCIHAGLAWQPARKCSGLMMTVLLEAYADVAPEYESAATEARTKSGPVSVIDIEE